MSDLLTKASILIEQFYGFDDDYLLEKLVEIISEMEGR